MAHPYSTNDLNEQIGALVNHHKPSNVTEEYFGPDRRIEEARGDDAGSVEVPSGLQVQIEARPELAPWAHFIEPSLN